MAATQSTLELATERMTEVCLKLGLSTHEIMHCALATFITGAVLSDLPKETVISAMNKMWAAAKDGMRKASEEGGVK